MISEEALEKVREAFSRVQRESDLRGWGLDNSLESVVEEIEVTLREKGILP